jgi:hypothetical protein
MVCTASITPCELRGTRGADRAEHAAHRRRQLDEVRDGIERVTPAAAAAAGSGGARARVAEARAAVLITW